MSVNSSTIDNPFIRSPTRPPTNPSSFMHLSNLIIIVLRKPGGEDLQFASHRRASGAQSRETIFKEITGEPTVLVLWYAPVRCIYAPICLFINSKSVVMNEWTSTEMQTRRSVRGTRAWVIRAPSHEEKNAATSPLFLLTYNRYPPSARRELQDRIRGLSWRGYVGFGVCIWFIYSPVQW